MFDEEILKKDELIEKAKLAWYSIMNGEGEEFRKLREVVLNTLKPPKYLYRYMTVDRFAGNSKTVLDDLETKNICKFWLQYATEMNDFYEFFPLLKTDFDEEVFNALKNDRIIIENLEANKINVNKISKDELVKFVYEILKAYVNRERKNTRLLCFTTSWKNNLMWAHYGDNNKGLCVQFNIEKLPIQLQTKFTKVYYKNIVDRLEIEIKDFLNDQIKFFIRFLENSYIKDKEWEYEDEYRLIFSGRDFENIEQLNYFCTNSEIVESVILGRKVKEEDLIKLNNKDLFTKFKFYSIKEELFGDRKKKLQRVKLKTEEEQIDDIIEEFE